MECQFGMSFSTYLHAEYELKAKLELVCPCESELNVP